MEIWKDIIGYESEYQISTFGRVKNIKLNKVLKGSLDKDGYPRVGIKGKTFRVNRLVAINFISNTNNNDQVNHINGIKADNRIENLEWMSCIENIRHAHRIGLSNMNHLTGENHPSSKYTNEFISKIKKELLSKRPIQICKEYNLPMKLVSAIKRETKWKSIQIQH
jgi:hypothetical protein